MIRTQQALESLADVLQTLFQFGRRFETVDDILQECVRAGEGGVMQDLAEPEGESL